MKIRQQFLFILIFAVFLLGNAEYLILPQVFTSTKVRAFNSDTKANLHNLYLGCRVFWADEGDSKTCTVSMAANEEYGYIQSQMVKIYGSGTKYDFCAVSWHQANSEIFKMDSTGQIKEHPDKYTKLLPRQLVYHSSILILPIATIILTLWAGGGSILRRKRKYPHLWVGIITFCWAFIAIITIGLAGSDYTYFTLGPGIFSILLFIPPLFSVLRASSLISWGTQIERAKDLPVYLENHSAKKLKKSGIYLLRTMGALLVLTCMYPIYYSKYKKDYYNQSVKLSEKIQSIMQSDPSSFQKMCQQHLR